MQANWMFEVDTYDSASGNFSFGRGGNQGARGNNEGGDFYIQVCRNIVRFCICIPAGSP